MYRFSLVFKVSFRYGFLKRRTIHPRDHLMKFDRAEVQELKRLGVATLLMPLTFALFFFPLLLQLWRSITGSSLRIAKVAS